MIRYCKGYWDDVNKALNCVPNLNKLKDTSFFITGGTGMICSSVVDLLLYFNQYYNAGIKIILGGRNFEKLCRRFPDFQNNKDFFFIPYNATVEKKLDINADFMIHGASNASPGDFSKEPVETILANIIGLNSLLNSAIKHETKRVLYISSSEVYGDSKENQPYQEEDYGYVDILSPRSGYPCSKRAAESLCIAYDNEFGLDTVIVRPGHIYGPSISNTDSRATAQFTRNAAKGENIVMKSLGSQLRSYCYTLDCASAILTVILNGESGNAYNISNPDSIVTISDVANMMALASGVKVIYEAASEIEKQGYTTMKNSSLNSGKLEKLGWKAAFNLKNGVESTLQYFLI